MKINEQAFPKRDMSRMEQFRKNAQDIVLADAIADDIAKYFGNMKKAFDTCQVCFTSYYMAAMVVLTLSQTHRERSCSRLKGIQVRLLR